MPAEDVRLRLRIAELLGPEALAHVPVPTLSTREVEWLGKLAHRAIYKPALTARRQGIMVAQWRRGSARSAASPASAEKPARCPSRPSRTGIRMGRAEAAAGPQRKGSQQRHPDRAPPEPVVLIAPEAGVSLQRRGWVQGRGSASWSKSKAEAGPSTLVVRVISIRSRRSYFAP